MGRKIDLIVLTAALAAGLYLLFMGAFGNIPIAVLCSFASVVCLRRLISRLPIIRISRRQKRRAAAEMLEKLTFSNDDDARREIISLIASAYPSEAADICVRVVLRHPTGTLLNADDVIAQWKSCRDCPRAVIVSTVSANSAARAVAEGLAAPKIRIIDAPQLISIIASTMTDVPKPAAHAKRSLRARADGFIRAASGARVGKCLSMGALLSVLFLLTASPAYLAAALILFFIVGVALKNRARARTLFADAKHSGPF